MSLAVVMTPVSTSQRYAGSWHCVDTTSLQGWWESGHVLSVSQDSQNRQNDISHLALGVVICCVHILLILCCQRLVLGTKKNSVQNMRTVYMFWKPSSDVTLKSPRDQSDTMTFSGYLYTPQQSELKTLVWLSSRTSRLYDSVASHFQSGLTQSSDTGPEGFPGSWFVRLTTSEPSLHQASVSISRVWY